jgi:hypothetical protein
MASQATIVSVVSDTALESVQWLTAWAANVSGTLRLPEATDPEGVAEIWAEVRHRPPVYSLAPFDPFAALVDAWADRMLGEGDALELSIGLHTNLDPPDFYAIDEHLEPTRRSWYLEGLFGLAPQRVVAFDGSPDDLARRIRTLGFGRALPDAVRIAEMARTFVPGTSGLVSAISSR